VRKYLVFEQQGSKAVQTDQKVDRWAVVRQDGMKLVHYDDGSEDLFNLNTDPGEASPLNLSDPTNLQIVQQLESYALADDVGKGSVSYHAWSGPNGGNLQTSSNWSSPTQPDRYWSATVNNGGASPAIAHVTSDVTTLGVEVKGASAMQVVNIHAGSTLTGLNEVRVGNHGRIDLAGGNLSTGRWVNVKAGGQIIGQGNVTGDVYNEGTISPGRTNDTPAWPVATPPA
jgi:hypothetical protein